jgi:hypothetical protein
MEVPDMAEPRSAPAGPPAGVLDVMRRSLLIVCYALLTQFLLGVTVNLFVPISGTHPGAGIADYIIGGAESLGWAVTHVWPFLALHILLGLALVTAALFFMIRGLRNWRSPVWAANVVGVVAVLTAAGSGIYSLIHPRVDSASMVMAIGAAVSLGAVITQVFFIAGFAIRGLLSRPAAPPEG